MKEIVTKNTGNKIIINPASFKDVQRLKQVILNEFKKELSKKGICVISGLAQGIDTASHLGAMHQKGKTIAVLGTGLNKIYPKENENL